MKKLFALVLAVLMICAMSVSVFAENVVGKRGNTGNYEDGLSDFPSNGSFSKNMEIKATVGSIEHRYAVDIEYDELTFNVDGAILVWNVNDLKYEYKEAEPGSSNKTYNVTVINYSDLPVDLTVVVTDTVNNDKADISSTFVTDDTNISTGTFKGEVVLGDAIGYNTTSIRDANSDAVKSFQINIESNDWEAVANYYTNYFATTSDTSATMGTMTITVAKDTSPSTGT